MQKRKSFLTGLLAPALCAVSTCWAQAQVAAVVLTVERNAAQFVAQGELQEMQVEVFDGAGQTVFRSPRVIGGSVSWNLLDTSGRTVPDGVYPCKITVRDRNGNTSEQKQSLSVLRTGLQAQLAAQSARANVGVRAIGPLTGEGTIGKIPKWVGVNQLGDSVMIETAGRIGIGTTTTTGLFTVKCSSTDSYGIYSSSPSSGTAVYGISSSGIALRGRHGSAAGANPAILGETFSTAASAVGIQGTVTSTTPGGNSAGIKGINNGTADNGIGVWGQQAGSGYGLYGTSFSGTGVVGEAGVGFGGASIGVHGTGRTGVVGVSPSSGGIGVQGLSAMGIGIVGSTDSRAGEAIGILGRINDFSPGDFSAAVKGENFGAGSGGIGVWGEHLGRGTGVYGSALEGIGIYGTNGNSNSSGYAGFFQGRVSVVGNLGVTGTLTAGVKNFKIDHPLDPANKYLTHAAIESSEVLGLYSGNAQTDARGVAIVTLPAWFEALNGDFRYQLTVIGQFAQAIISQEIKGNQFSIKTNKPNVKVSWQVTAKRRDAYIKAHPMDVEILKVGAERGRYLHPAEFGQPLEKGINTRAELATAPPTAR